MLQFHFVKNRKVLRYWFVRAIWVQEMEPFIRLSIPISWCVKIERSLRLQVVRVSGYYETLSSFCMNSVIGFGWLDESPSAIWGNRKPVFWNFKQRNKLKNKIMFITCLEIHFSVVWYNTTDIKLNFGCLLWSKDTSRERVWRHNIDKCWTTVTAHYFSCNSDKDRK